jgi:hypothetical protein
MEIAMTDYEKQLQAVSEAQNWTLPPSVDKAISTLQDISKQYGKIASRNTDLKGKAAEAATESFDADKKTPDSIASVLGRLKGDIKTANSALEKAKSAYNDLPGTDVDPVQKAAILAAGGITAGPLGVLVGEAGIQIWQDHLKKQRDAAAKEALDTLDTSLAQPSSTARELPLDFPPVRVDPPPGGGGNRDGKAIVWNASAVPPASSPSGTPAPAPAAAPAAALTGVGSGGMTVTTTKIVEPPRPPRPPVVTTTTTPTVDSSTSTGGGTSTGSGTGSGSGSASQVSGSGSGSSSSDPGNGLSVDSTMSGGIAGGVTTAAGVMGGSRLATQAASNAANAAAAAANGGAGGLGGMPGGSGLGPVTGGGLGGAPGTTSSSTMGGRAGAAAAGSRASAAEAEGRAAAGARSGSNVMAPGNGGGGSSEKKRAAGLLGLSAPTLDDDGEPRARSAAAGPGGRGSRSLGDGSGASATQ